MQYLSTRGQQGTLNFQDVLMNGLARDGGLYLPAQWPAWSPEKWQSLAGASYVEVATAVMQPFVQPVLDADQLKRIVSEAYAGFRHQQVAPLVQIGPSQWIMELFHGPTLAFKDVAMQVLGRLYDHVLTNSGQRITVVGATSGDTGSAAIEAVRGSQHASIFIMHPHGRTSAVQRRQMTTVHAPNVFNIAIEGTFDDCQNLLKAMFMDADFRDHVHLSGVNSINWARVLPQVVYYVTAALSLGAPQRSVCFSVPTGNFGDIFAGYVACRMGLPIRQLLIATNINDILTRALTDGQHALSAVHPTLSPSMDIQISSNFERLLFEAGGRDPALVCALMQQLREQGRFAIPANVLNTIRQQFAAHRVNEADTLATMRQVHERCGMLIDPHTAVGVQAAWQAYGEQGSAEPVVTLATAHPAKFPDAVEQATGIRPPLPAFMADLHEREERCTVLPNDLATVQAWIRERCA